MNRIGNQLGDGSESYLSISRAKKCFAMGKPLGNAGLSLESQQAGREKIIFLALEFRIRQSAEDRK
jgi:hypothetical protein